MVLTKSEAKTSRLIFYAAAIVAVLYGLLFLSLPEWALQLSQDPGAPKNAGWLRWSGAFLIGIALAAWLAATQPDRQRALVVGLALSCLLVALSSTAQFPGSTKERSGSSGFPFLSIWLSRLQ